MTDLKENFQETVSASLIISHTQPTEHLIQEKEIENLDLIKEEIPIQKVDRVVNLTGLRENFQETVSASLIIQKENHMLGIDLTELFKEEIQIQKAVHPESLTGLKKNFQETESASHFNLMVRRPSVQKEYLTGKKRMILRRISGKRQQANSQREILLKVEIGTRRVQHIHHSIN